MYWNDVYVYWIQYVLVLIQHKACSYRSKRKETCVHWWNKSKISWCDRGVNIVKEGKDIVTSHRYPIPCWGMYTRYLYRKWFVWSTKRKIRISEEKMSQTCLTRALRTATSRNSLESISSFTIYHAVNSFRAILQDIVHVWPARHSYDTFSFSRRLGKNMDRASIMMFYFEVPFGIFC